MKTRVKKPPKLEPTQSGQASVRGSASPHYLGQGSVWDSGVPQCASTHSHTYSPFKKPVCKHRAPSPSCSPASKRKGNQRAPDGNGRPKDCERQTPRANNTRAQQKERSEGTESNLKRHLRLVSLE